MKKHTIFVVGTMTAIALALILQNDDIYKGVIVNIDRRKANTDYIIPSPELVKGNQIRHKIHLSNDLLSSPNKECEDCQICFSLMIGTFNRKNNSKYLIEISQNENIISDTLYSAQCIDNAFYNICFDPLELNNYEAGVAEVVITSYAEAGDGIAFFWGVGSDTSSINFSAPLKRKYLIDPPLMKDQYPSKPLINEYALNQNIVILPESRREIRRLPSDANVCVGVFMAAYDRVNKGTIRASISADTSVLLDTIIDVSKVTDNSYMNLCFLKSSMDTLAIGHLNIALTSHDGDITNCISSWLTRDTINGSVMGMPTSSLVLHMTEKDVYIRSLNLITFIECKCARVIVRYVLFVSFYSIIFGIILFVGLNRMSIMGRFKDEKPDLV